MIRHILRTSLQTVASLLLVVGTTVAHQGTATAAGACSPALPTDKGQVVDSSVTVPATATYRVWSRILAPDSSDNSFYMQIDDKLCNASVGGNAADIGTNKWKWVDYTDGNTATTIDVALTAGTHKVILAGEDPGVEVDRVILTGDTSCTPTGDGSNCANPPDTTAPTVAITSPTNNASAPAGTLNVTVTASDDVAIAKVDLYVDGGATPKATDTGNAGTYSFTVNTSAFSVGAHKLVAKATDTASLPNSTSSSTVNFTVTDSSAPTVSLTSPTAGATLSGTTSMTATAADNVGVSKVEFYVDGTFEGSDPSPPYSISLDTTKLPNASHSFTAKAYDAAGNTATSTAINATVDNSSPPPVDSIAPAVSITSPANNASVKGTVSVGATATDNVGITKVEFYVDGGLVKTAPSAPYSYSLDTTKLSNTSHTLLTKAYDAAGNVGTSSPVTIKVSNHNYIAEDINTDGVVNGLDFTIVLQYMGQSGSAAGRADINGSGTVDGLDFTLVLQYMGTTD